MKSTILLFITLAFSLLVLPPSAHAQKAKTDVLTMKSVPDGNYLLNLQDNGKDLMVNIQVSSDSAICVAAAEPRHKGMVGNFQLIGNGVFMVQFSNKNERATQFWVFGTDGTAAVKEIPDEGQKQTAVPVKDTSLKVPGKK